MTQESQQPHKRRVRYKGKYPKKFEEKYKELQPEKYQDTIAHVIQKGNTPAGMHISIMVKEILDFLEIKPGQTGFDATLGYGGHTKAMLECLKGEGHIYATDCKRGLPPRGLGFLKEVCREVSIPVYGIGGIKFDEEQWNDMEKCGAVGGCVMSGMMEI